MIIPLTMLGVLFFITVSAFFDASEIAILNVNRVSIRRLKDEGNARARFIEKLHNNPEWIFAITLFSADISIISATSLFEYMMNNYVPQRYSVFISSIIMTIIVLLFAQIIPKTLGLKYSGQLALKTSLIIEFFSYFIYPVIKVAESVIWLLRKMGFKIPVKKAIITRAEIILFLEQAERKMDEQYTLDMISSSIFFTETPLVDIMTSIDDFPVLSVNATVEEALLSMEREELESIPVYAERPDNIIGIVYVKDLFGIDLTRGLSDLLRIPLTFNARVNMVEVLGGLRNHQNKLAFVYDKAEGSDFSNIVGVVTLDDVVEQVVGEI